MATKKLTAKKPARVAKRNVAAQNEPARKVVLASLGAVALSRKEGVRVINRIIEQGQDLRRPRDPQERHHKCPGNQPPQCPTQVVGRHRGPAARHHLRQIAVGNADGQRQAQTGE